MHIECKMGCILLLVDDFMLLWCGLSTDPLLCCCCTVFAGRFRGGAATKSESKSRFLPLFMGWASLSYMYCYDHFLSLTRGTHNATAALGWAPNFCFGVKSCVYTKRDVTLPARKYFSLSISSGVSRKLFFPDAQIGAAP